jgi:4-amino-4-deoxy-L-arabinose transferase-like glycosyltransferase
MMLLNVLAAWLVVVGAQSRRAWPVVAAGGVLGLAFNVKLFEALIAVPAIAVLMLLAVEGPVRRRVLALGGSLVAFVGVSLSWVVAASVVPLGGRPWPIGSTNGGIWNVVFGFNGLDRLRVPAGPAALALDPPGSLRFLQASGRNYPNAIGTMLLAALVLGATAAVVTLLRGRWSWRTHRLQLAGAAFLGTWLVVGVGLLSQMQRLQPRYLEAVTPAVAAVAGVGLAGLVAAARRGPRAGGAVLVAAVAAVVTGGAAIAHPPTAAVFVAVAAAAGCAVAAAARDRPQRPAALAVLAIVAVLAVPASAAIAVAAQHRSDAGLALPPATASLSRFLTAQGGHARFEVASPNVDAAAPLIIRDGRPVLMLTSLRGRPLLDGTQLRQLVATGQVRFLLGQARCGSGACAVVLRWAGRHAVDVSAAAGQPPGTLYRLTVAPVHGSAK